MLHHSCDYEGDMTAPITVVECRPHIGGTANCVFCLRVVNLTFPHASVRSERKQIGFCICPECADAAMVALISDVWPETVMRAFGR